MKCCGTILSVACIPTCFTSKPGMLLSWRLSDRVLLYLNSALGRTPWKTNGEHHFRSAHSERNLKLYEILQISYTKNKSCGKFSCCMLERVLRLTYLTSFVHGKCCNFLLSNRGIQKRLSLVCGVYFSLCHL